MNHTPHAEPNRLTLPNLLTGFRFVATPFLLWLAWQGSHITFLVLLALCFLTDVLDGLAARMTGQVSEFGAVLDSWADVTLYATISIGCWWLWPQMVRKEWAYVAIIIASYLLPTLIGFSKFGCFTSYHTWLVKTAAAAMGITLYLLLLGVSAWPFRAAAIICLLAASEEIGLTLLLSEPKSNVRSIWPVLAVGKRRNR